MQYIFGVKWYLHLSDVRANSCKTLALDQSLIPVWS